MMSFRALVFGIGTGIICMLLCAVGCSNGSGDASAFLPGAAGQTGNDTLSNGASYPMSAASVPSMAPTTNGAGYIGSWVHTYEYFDNTYRTTLVINADGSAVYYNEEAELGNFNASWQYSGDGIALQRSDGVTATARMQGGVLVEQSVENGVSYTAEYQRLS
ncbi:MAG: hypothetical protein II735_07890 [Clostridia bacterium]|nr:hypothetical protein [Clostridia bacterium]